MKRLRRLSSWLLSGLAAVMLAAVPVQGQEIAKGTSAPEVVVFGATPGGIAAAIAAARNGHSVLLIEPTSRIGGMVTNGLSHPDFRTFESLSGLFYELNQRTLKHYQQAYGADSQQVADTLHGTHGEPKVNLQIFNEMLAEFPQIEVRDRTRVKGIQVEKTAEGQRIRSLTLSGPNGETEQVTGKVFIDGSYEGDLMALAGVPYRVGREAKSEYGESLAPEAADTQVQGYNFRLCMTNVPENRVLPSQPEGYDRNDFVGILELIRKGTIKQACVITSGGSNPIAVYKIQKPVLPNFKHDVNDMSRAPVRLSLPELSHGWPDGDEETREKIFQEHLRHNVGLLYFLQNDEEVPESFRTAAREYGLCRDEFVDSDNLPVQLYVREARRLHGKRVFTEQDVSASPDGVRAVFVDDAIAMGDYGPNCHGTGHEGSRFGGRHSGEFYQAVAPYQISYGALLPPNCENLLVPVPMSASHVGFCALRLEPIWMSLGEAAGEAAHLALQQQLPVQKVSPEEIRDQLHAKGAATIYVTDVPHGSPDFQAVQWWGSAGGLHGVETSSAPYGTRGERLTGQYYHAFPQHAVQLNEPLTSELKTKWLALASKLGVSSPDLNSAQTRGDFIRTAYRLSHKGK